MGYTPLINHPIVSGLSWSMFSRKGTSEVIAAMFLIIIAVGASISLYAYASGLMGRLQGISTQQPYLEHVVVDYYDWTTLSNVVLTLRNVGVAQVTMVDFFIAGTKNTTALTFNGCSKGVLAVQSSCVVTFPMPTGLTASPGIAYSVKIVTKDGAVFSYSCIAGQAA